LIGCGIVNEYVYFETLVSVMTTDLEVEFFFLLLLFLVDDEDVSDS